ncbi:MAG: hypothetical protein PWQ37_1315 [Candidatus Petromonas sp.]|jgi:hypothetical protein|nr:hypothetical protein [Clostridiales bacterium]MDK2918582.1 hypothetical protein [Candidatus Petromonas sp.]
MARNKAIFDADILINLIKTNSIDYILNHFEQIYISDYVFENELIDGTAEKKKIKKLINQKLIKVLYRSDLTPIQRKIYYEAYNTLEEHTYTEVINEGERITASYASAHKVCYYMSDDNKAAPHIRTLTNIEVINYCDLLYISYRINEDDAIILNEFYNSYISIFDEDKIPRTIKKRDKSIRTFPEMMAKCCLKFEKNQRLFEYLNLMIKK